MILIQLLALLLLASCSGAKKTSDTIHISILRGPSAIALAKLSDKPSCIGGRSIIVDIADSPEIIQAQIIKGEADVAVLPMVSAANLYNKGLSYKILGCPIWGTLFLVGPKDIQNSLQLKGKTIHLFGAGTTPDIITQYFLMQKGLKKGDISFNYTLGTPREILQALLAHKIETAIISEPFLSIALQKDSTLHIIADMNRPDNLQAGFAQTAIIISREMEPFRPMLDSLMRNSCNYAVSSPDSAIQIVERNHIFAPGMLSAESVGRCMISYRSGHEIKDDIFRFLNIMYQYEPKSIGMKLPDSSFIPDTR